MSYDETVQQISGYIRTQFLDGDPKGELDEETPLLEWGILNSMNTALLLAFIREELGVAVPPECINGANFCNIKKVAMMVTELGQRATT